MTRMILGSRRMALAVALLVVFNAAAAVWFARAGGSPGAMYFAVWFVGDLVVALVALGLTESR
jgi:hypothetical protein